MAKTIKTTYTDEEFRQLIREEIQSILNEIPGMPTIEIDEVFLTVNQVSTVFKLAKGSIYNLVHQGKIPFHKSGRKVLFKKSELSKWMKKGTDL